jgi:hypothetical protein
MRSQQLNLEKYGDSDKTITPILKYYDPVLAPWVDKEIKLLELGIYKGGSLLLWRDYFPMGTITGIDIGLPDNFTGGERINVFEGSQTDARFLTGVANEVAPGGFDIIIDDASHIGDLTKTAFWHLFENYLKPGGLYAIEDWGTGFFRDFPDGKGYKSRNKVISAVLKPIIPIVNTKRRIPVRIPHHSHKYGMVGFIKELIDEQGASDVTKRSYKSNPTRASKFEQMIITPNVVFVKKASEDNS